MRMLIEMLPFIAPKLTAGAHLHEGGTFATRLEKCIARSDKVGRVPRFKRPDGDPREYEKTAPIAESGQSRTDALIKSRFRRYYSSIAPTSGRECHLCAQQVKGECSGGLPERGKLGRMVHSSCDHRRRIVGHRLLNRRCWRLEINPAKVVSLAQP